MSASAFVSRAFVLAGYTYLKAVGAVTSGLFSTAVVNLSPQPAINPSVMSDRKALARAISARAAPRFIEIKEEKRDRRPIAGPRADALGRERTCAATSSLKGQLVLWPCSLQPTAHELKDLFEDSFVQRFITRKLFGLHPVPKTPSEVF